MKLLRQFLGPFLALLLTFGSVAEVSAPVTVAAAGVVLGVSHAQAATPAQKAVVLNGVPSWVLRASGALPSIDMDFAHNRAWAGGVGVRAPPQFLTTTRASTGYAQWADGHLSSFGSNVPRITDLGLLVEQAATNIALQSQTFTNATWSKNSASVSGTTTAPDGTNTALKLVEAAATNTHLVNQTISVSNGTSYTTSIYFKPAERTWAYIQWNDLASGFPRAWINLSTGALGTVQAGLTATVTAAANGFYRLNVVGNSNGAAPGSAVISFGATTGDGVVSYAGDGASGIYLWQADLVALGFATSPIATTTVAVTRAADNIVLAGSALTAALAAKAALFKTNLGAGIVSVVNLGIFNGSPFQNFQFASTSTVAITNGTNFATATLGAGSYSGAVSAAFGFDATSITAIANGGTKVTSANAWGSTSGSFSVGSNFGTNHALNGYLTRLTFGTTKGQFDGITAP